MRRILPFILFFAISTSSFAQAKLIEKVTRTGDELTIPYEMYRLKNGLTIIIHEDHSDPLVHVDVTYHVGRCQGGSWEIGVCPFLRAHDVSGKQTCRR